VDRSQIAKYEIGKSQPAGDTVVKLAEALEVTTDYLYGRGFEGLDVRGAAAQMAYAIFAADESLPYQQRERCGRALSHAEAPRTTNAWRAFSQMVDLVIGPPGSQGQLELVRGKPRPRHQKRR